MLTTAAPTTAAPTTAAPATAAPVTAALVTAAPATAAPVTATPAAPATAAHATAAPVTAAPATTPPTTVALVTQRVTFRSVEATFTSDLLNPSSEAFQNRASLIKTQVSLNLTIKSTGAPTELFYQRAQAHTQRIEI